jgi:uncharacterized membrane protein
MKKFCWRFGCAAAFVFLLSQASVAQKLVDPDSVAPEFRAAAEKRRAEQLKLNECAKKANVAKVLVRDRAAFVSICVDSNNQTSD